MEFASKLCVVYYNAISIMTHYLIIYEQPTVKIYVQISNLNNVKIRQCVKQTKQTLSRLFGVQKKKTKKIFERVDHLQDREWMKFKLIPQYSNKRNWHVPFESFFNIHWFKFFWKIVFLPLHLYIRAPENFSDSLKCQLLRSSSPDAKKYVQRNVRLWNYEIGMNHTHTRSLCPTL